MLAVAERDSKGSPMIKKPRTRGITGLFAVLALTVFAPSDASAQELRVMTSGAFRAAFLQLVPEFERATQNRIVMISGASLWDGPTTIPGRWARGELADVATLADDALAELLKRGKVVPDSRVQLVRLAE